MYSVLVLRWQLNYSLKVFKKAFCLMWNENYQSKLYKSLNRLFHFSHYHLILWISITLPDLDKFSDLSMQHCWEDFIMIWVKSVALDVVLWCVQSHGISVWGIKVVLSILSIGQMGLWVPEYETLMLCLIQVNPMAGIPTKKGYHVLIVGITLQLHVIVETIWCPQLCVM